MRKVLLTFGLMLSFGFMQAQSISLDSCISAARQNWPAFKKQMSIAEKRKLVQETLNKNYLPKLNISGQASYQSEVITFPDVPTMPGFFPDLPLDNYNVEANLNQTLWDGGIIKSQKDIQVAQTEIEIQQLNVETYGLIGKINELYTNYLFLSTSEKILLLSVDQLDNNIKNMSSAVENGMVLSSELDNLKAEKLKLKKELLNIHSAKQSTIDALNIITDLKLDTTYQFDKPQLAANTNILARPEIQLLDAQISYSQASISKYKTNRMPKLMAFGRLGYGRPGFDPLTTDLHAYYMVGARFSWDVWDWNITKKQKQQIHLQQQIIKDNKESLQKQIAMEERQYMLEEAKYEQQIALDNEIEVLKKSVYLSAESKMKNGSITSTGFLKSFNEWKRALLTTEADKLRLLKAQINYQHSKGISN
jgi:outer membrane protein TolC